MGTETRVKKWKAKKPQKSALRLYKKRAGQRGGGRRADRELARA